jgi:23S rRNA maturation mini-RNase III
MFLKDKGAEDFKRGIYTEKQEQGKALQIFYANSVTVEQLIGYFCGW